MLGTPGLPDRLDAAAAEIDAGDWVESDKLARRHRLVVIRFVEGATFTGIVA